MYLHTKQRKLEFMCCFKYLVTSDTVFLWKLITSVDEINVTKTVLYFVHVFCVCFPPPLFYIHLCIKVEQLLKTIVECHETSLIVLHYSRISLNQMPYALGKKSWAKCFTKCLTTRTVRLKTGKPEAECKFLHLQVFILKFAGNISTRCHGVCQTFV